MELQKYSDRLTAKHLWQQALVRKRLLALALLGPVGALALNIAVPLYISKIFAGLAHAGGQPAHYILPLSIAVLTGIIANRIGFTSFMAYQAYNMADMQSTSLEELLSRSVGFHNNHIGGKLVSDASDYSQAFLQLSGAFITNIIPFVLTLVVGVTVVLITSWQLGVALLVIVFITLVWALAESHQRSNLRSQRLLASKKVTSHLSDTIVNAQAVKTFAREDSEMHTHRGLNDKLLQLRLRDWQRSGRSGNNRMAVLLIMQVLFIALAINAIKRNPGLLAIGIFAFTYTFTLLNRLFDINNMTRNVEEALLMAAPMAEIMQEQEEVRDKPSAGSLQIRNGAIEFNSVGFSYEDAPDKMVFSNLSLSIAPGEKIGLVGPSGGGKSTFTRLLLRFEDLRSGNITIDKQDISLITQRSLRRAIAYVPQEPLLFHRSIRENIAYGNLSANSAAIENAARQAYAHDFITSLPEGYDTIVGERGVKLSGGQRQLIAIARAILKDAPILILDEATSALDSESEKYIQEALTALMKNRTTIVIAHRLSTIQRLDRIIVLDEGQIKEEGSHQQLLKFNGLYAKLWAHQSGGFIEE